MEDASAWVGRDTLLCHKVVEGASALVRRYTLGRDRHRDSS